MYAAYAAEVNYRGREFITDANVVENINNVATFLTDQKTKFGLMFSGKCGNGKTTMLYAIQSAINYLADENLISSDFGLRIEDAKDIASYMKDRHIYQSMRSHSLLGIEDIGREAAEVMDYGNILNPVIDLLEYRYNNQLFTVITTNLTPKQIREKYGKRIADRFNEMFYNVVFENETYRGR